VLSRHEIQCKQCKTIHMAKPCPKCNDHVPVERFKVQTQFEKLMTGLGEKIVQSSWFRFRVRAYNMNCIYKKIVLSSNRSEHDREEVRGSYFLAKARELTKLVYSYSRAVHFRRISS